MKRWRLNLLFDEDKVYGIFAIIIPKRSGEATFVNIVGEIAPERIEELLGNLSNFGANRHRFWRQIEGAMEKRRPARENDSYDSR